MNSVCNERRHDGDDGEPSNAAAASDAGEASVARFDSIASRRAAVNAARSRRRIQSPACIMASARAVA